MISPSLVELEQAWAERLDADPDFIAAVGLDAANEVKLYRGWPSELMAQSKPDPGQVLRVTYFRVDVEPLTATPELVLMQSDIWGWRTQWDRVIAADNAMMTLLTDGFGGGARTWYDATRQNYVSSRLVDGSDPSEGPFLIRRRRLWEVAPA